MKKKIRNIGIKVKVPSKKSEDRHDPFFGNLGIRGRIFTGTVVSMNSAKTAKIEFSRLIPIKKYERYEKRRTGLLVHNPESLGVEVGDLVRVAECRPISKTKNFVIIERLEK
ncbi:MAG: 30S ribosomal protein S17 [Candidatus Woesearchaeota archaeon]